MRRKTFGKLNDNLSVDNKILYVLNILIYDKDFTACWQWRLNKKKFYYYYYYYYYYYKNSLIDRMVSVTDKWTVGMRSRLQFPALSSWNLGLERYSPSLMCQSGKAWIRNSWSDKWNSNLVNMSDHNANNVIL